MNLCRISGVQVFGLVTGVDNGDTPGNVLTLFYTRMENSI